MKNYKSYIVILALIVNIGLVDAQTLNWASLKNENKQIINASLALEDGVIYGLGYGYKVNSRLFPVVMNIEYSFPSGNKLFDDFKTKIGALVGLINFHNFQLSGKIYGVFRKYENDLVRLVNFGSEASGMIGYYRNHWFFAGEFGFDKAIVTHFKHSSLYLDRFQGAKNGWYEPATGGNYYYGLQAGFSLKHSDVYLRAGKKISQDFKTKPMVPIYAQIGYNLRFR